MDTLDRQGSRDPEGGDNQNVTRSKASIETLPLELLLEVASYFPDPHTAVKLSSTCRSLHQNLAGSQFFWFRFGSQRLKKFQTFSPKYDYHGHIMKVISGSIKSSCQICLKAKTATQRKTLGKVLCLQCLDENIILQESVEKIPKIDLKNIETIKRHHITLQNPYDPGVHTNFFCWLPSVKREIKRVYKLPWKEFVGKHVPTVWLASPGTLTNYRIATCKMVIDTALALLFETYKKEYLEHLVSVWTEEEFKQFIRPYPWSVSSEIHKLWAPIEGQDETVNDMPIAGIIDAFIDSYFGPEIEHKGMKCRHAQRGYLWPWIESAHIERIENATRANTRSPPFICQICSDENTATLKGDPSETETFAFNSPKSFHNPHAYLAHVWNEHPQVCYRLDWI